MGEISGLFHLKQVAFFNKSNDDNILCLDSSESDLFFGTSKGKLFQFRVSEDELVYNKSFDFRMGAVVQLDSLKKEDLLLAVRNKALVHVVYSSLTPVVEIGPGNVELISINRQVKGSKLILFALATNKKQIHIYKGVLTDGGLQLDVIEKILTSSNVIKMCFHGRSLCYATADRYFVLDMTVQPRVHHELLAINDNPLIVSVGSDEFAVCGQDGLIVFVRADGTSFRPPIDLNLNVVDMLFVSPVLYVIGMKNVIAYNIHDENMKIRLHCDNLHLLTHVAGQTFIISNEKRVFKLSLIESFAENIKQALKTNTEDGIQLMNGVVSVFPNEERVSSVCNQLLLEESIEKLNNGKFDTGLDLFLRTGVNPTSILSGFKKVNEGVSCWDVSLDVLESFLDKLLCDDKFSDFSRIVQSYLIRVKILQDTIDFNDIDENFIEDEGLKRWLLANNLHGVLAEFYFEFGHTEDALGVWKSYPTNLRREQLESLESMLSKIAQGGDSIVLLTETLEWLTPLTPELAMNIVRQMLDVDIDWLVDTFKPHPELLLSYLEERAGDNQQNPKFNTCMSKAYVSALSSDDWKVRSSFRSFLTSIPFTEEVAATIPHEKRFAVERLIYTTTEEEAESSTRKLVEEDLNAAEILYLKFSTQQPYLIKFLIPKYTSKEDKSGKAQERLLHLLSQIRPFHGIEQIISVLPSSYLTRDTITLFQNAVKEYSQSRSSNCLRLALDKMVKEAELTSQFEKESKSFRFVAEDRCDLCRQRLLNESISFMNNKAVHSRCSRKL